MYSFTKKEALAVIHSCAVAYEENLAHKNLMFVITHGDKASFFEAGFLPRNFLHLTGVKTKYSSVDFYNMAVKNKLNEDSIQLTSDGIANKKLSILPALMKIYLTARMAGDYDYSKSLLVTDKLAGTVTAAMGFRKNGSVYVPNTALNTDLRDIVHRPVQKIAVMFVKPKQDEKYTNLTYIAKGVTIDDAILQAVLKEKTDLENMTAAFPIPRKTTENNED